MALRALLVAPLVLLLAGCFGNSIERNADPSRMLVVNLGTNRYVYSVTRYEHLPAAPGLARPTRVVGEGDEEIATIIVTPEYSGWGGGGLRSAAGEFHRELGELSAALGGTHFVVQDATVTSGTIRGLTAVVIRRP